MRPLFYALSLDMDGVMVALNPPRIDFVAIEDGIARLKLVPPDSDFVVVARALDISLGDSDRCGRCLPTRTSGRARQF